MKIINLFGGPGTGKSTFASFIFSQLKVKGESVQIVTEFAKDCVYEDRLNVLKKDQLYVFAKQNHKLMMLKGYQHSPDFAITDSPLLLSNIYGRKYKIISDTFENLVTETFNSYQNINFLLKRQTSTNFQHYGRIQNFNDAKDLDYQIEEFLIKNNIQFTVLNVENLEIMFKNLYKYIKTEI